jgi:hypothetical protein
MSNREPVDLKFEDLLERSEDQVPMLAAESSLSKDWLTPEEDEAGAGL